MANEVPGFAHAGAADTATEAVVTGSVSEALPHWFSRIHLSAWALANAFAIVAVLLLVGTDTTVLTWAVFMSVNLALATRLGGLRAHAPAWENPGLVTGLAAVVGLGWAATVFAAAAGTSEFTPLVGCLAISYAMTLMSLPVFGHQGNAYPALLVGYASPIGWFLAQRFGVLVALGGVTLGLLPPLLAARLHRRALEALTGIVAQAFRIVPRELDTAPSSGNFLDDARSQLGFLQHAMADHRFLQATIGALGDGVLCVDRNGRVEHMNAIAEVLTGYTLREARGQFVNYVACLQMPGTRDVSLAAVHEVLRTGTLQRGDERATLRRRDGVSYGIDYAVSALRIEGEIAGAVMLLRDVTERRNALRTATWRAAHDPLTGLSNRADFEHRLRETLEREIVGTPVAHALCVIDIDHFAFINDTFGTAAGDSVLLRIGELLRQQIRGVDLVARLDGDRFGILLFHCPFDKATLIAESLRGHIETLNCVWQEHELGVKVSVGLVEVAHRECPLGDLLSAVDYACHKAKRAGGNRVQTLRADDDHVRRRDQYFTRIKEIQTALRYDRFELYFQTILPVGASIPNLNYCELLLRMRTDENELLAPRDFLMTAERYHLLPDIDRWAVKAAVDALRLEHPCLLNMDVVAINISAQSVSDEKFAEFVIRQIAEAGVEPRKLCFEIAESHLIRQWDKACVFIAAVKELGCQIALDGFGLGTHSFQVLKKLHVDYLKIHEDFVRNVTANSVDYEVVLGISRVAKTLRINTIASGVSNLATRETLRNMGVDYVQGFMVEPPRPILELAAQSVQPTPSTLH